MDYITSIGVVLTGFVLSWIVVRKISRGWWLPFGGTLGMILIGSGMLLDTFVSRHSNIADLGRSIPSLWYKTFEGVGLAMLAIAVLSIAIMYYYGKNKRENSSPTTPSAKDEIEEDGTAAIEKQFANSGDSSGSR